jgi:hypothetical protein
MSPRVIPKVIARKPASDAVGIWCDLADRGCADIKKAPDTGVAAGRLIASRGTACADLDQAGSVQPGE